MALPDGPELARAAAMDPEEVLAALGSDRGGLSESEAARRLTAVGPNAVRTHRTRLWAVLGRQLRSPLLLLLLVTASVLADGVVEGRRIFANTIKYVLMGTSSNFGNMFSAAVASTFLTFLPMLPSQILLNNLLYDTNQLTIPTDAVDAEMLRRPAHWDIRLIRRFMLFFGPISSIFDFVTFGVMLGVFDAGPALFRSGWFVESLATQTLVIFVIRTRRTPFFRSRPSRPLLLASLGCVTLGAVLPFTPVADALGFRSLPVAFFVALVLMVAAYLTLVEFGKRWFFSRQPTAIGVRRPRRERLVHRRAARWSHAASLSR